MFMKFGKEIYAKDFDPKDIIISPNSLYRKVVWNERSQKWDLGNWWYLKKGRSTYRIWEIRYFDESGVVYKSRNGFMNKWRPIANGCVIFNDINKITLKRKVDFKMKSPFIISERDGYYYKGAEAVLYVPLRYLKKMGYWFEEETLSLKGSYTYKKYLVTPFFSFEVEKTEWTNLEEQKQALLEALKRLKQKENLELMDIKRAVREKTDLYLRV
jgi:hypothetical protein